MTITTSGTTTLAVEAGREYVLAACGTFGAGTLTPKWSDGTTDVTVSGPAGDIAMTTGAAYVITAPTTILKLVLAGATGPNITALVTPKLRT